MNHTDFFKALKADTLSGAYLFHGAEEYVKDSALKALYESVDDAARELNTQTLDAADAQGIIDACETLPFFAKRRIAVCRALPREADWERLSGYIGNIPATTLLVFFQRGQVNKTSGLYKALSKQNRVVEFETLNETETVKWLTQRTVQLGVTITPSAAQYLAAIAGQDLYTLGNELTKAAGYAGAGREVSREIISLAVTRNIEYGVFAMIDCFVAGKAEEGLRALSELLTRESPFGLASLLSNNFRQMLLARRMIDRGLGRAAAVSALGGSPYAAGKAYDAAKRYSEGKLTECVRRFSDVDYLQISGRMDARDALEQAILRALP
jgi:DNA polymerase-3 subunit delta